MARHASGIFLRNDRVAAARGTQVRVVSADRKHAIRAQLLELGSTDLLLSALRPPALGLGERAIVSITLPGRYIEFELGGVVAWEDGVSFGVRFEYLTARQAYGISLARELVRAPVTTATPRRAARR